MIYPTLLSAYAEKDYNIILTYDNHETRCYDFSKNLSHPYYASLSDFDLFKKIIVKNGEIFWESGQDFCPFTLYENSKL